MNYYGIIIVLRNGVLTNDKNIGPRAWFKRRFNNWKNRVEHVGAKSGYDPEGILMI